MRPARVTHIWCPTENLTGFDLAPRDRVLFVKTSGGPTQDVQRSYLAKNGVYEKWLLEEIYVAEVSSKIYGRREYCLRRKVSFDRPLWRLDPRRDLNWRWSPVFEFSQVSCVQKKIPMKILFGNELTHDFGSSDPSVLLWQIARDRFGDLHSHSRIPCRIYSSVPFTSRNIALL